MTLLLCAGAALCELAGCFAVWAWWREGRSPLWLLPAVALLLLFAWVLARVPTAFAGRAYAAYGGVYVAASLLWLWAVEGQRPDRWDLDRWDLGGGLVVLAGSALVLWAPRGA